MIFLRAIVATVLIFSLGCVPTLADYPPSLIASKKLADIYVSQSNSKKAQELLQRKSGPSCPKCHSAKAVVPIVYYHSHGWLYGYDSVPPPREYEDAYWCPTFISKEHPEQWYCLNCHMPFFDQATGDPIYEQDL